MSRSEQEQEAWRRAEDAMLESIIGNDEKAITLDVAGVVRQMAGLPPMMEVMCITENGEEFFLRPGSVSDPLEEGESVIGPPLYFFRISKD